MLLCPHLFIIVTRNLWHLTLSETLNYLRSAVPLQETSLRVAGNLKLTSSYVTFALQGKHESCLFRMSICKWLRFSYSCFLRWSTCFMHVYTFECLFAVSMWLTGSLGDAHQRDPFQRPGGFTGGLAGGGEKRGAFPHSVSLRIMRRILDSPGIWRSLHPKLIIPWGFFWCREYLDDSSGQGTSLRPLMQFLMAFPDPCDSRNKHAINPRLCSLCAELLKLNSQPVSQCAAC